MECPVAQATGSLRRRVKASPWFEGGVHDAARRLEVLIEGLEDSSASKVAAKAALGEYRSGVEAYWFRLFERAAILHPDPAVWRAFKAKYG
jgi:hypothetical protein